MATLNKLVLKSAEKARDNIVAAQKNQISILYQNWANDLASKIKYYEKATTASSALSEKYYRELAAQLKQTSHEVAGEIYKQVKANMYTIADSVVSANVDWLSTLGFNKDGINAAMSYVPDNVVRNLITGQVYESGWSLSERIWSDNEDTLAQIYKIVAQGRAQQMPVADVADMLSKYVSPGAAKSWNLKMPDGKRIYPRNVDYNAQRLARTLAQHTYQQSFVATTEFNPFIGYYIWDANGSRTCDLCKARDQKKFAKDALPLDHPNGMCTMVPAVDPSMNQKLADWFNGEDGDFPEIDIFARKLGYTPKPGKDPMAAYLDKWGSSTKNPTYWYNTLSPEQKLEAKALKDATDLNWKDWYVKNVYTGDGTNLGGTAVGKKLAGKKSVGKVGSAATQDVDDWLGAIKAQKIEDMRAMEVKAMKEIGDANVYGVYGLKEYTGSSYVEMNHYLRRIADGADEAVEAAKLSGTQRVRLQQALEGLDSTRLESDVIVRRGTDIGDLAGLFMDNTTSTRAFSANKRAIEQLSVGELNDRFSNAVGTYNGFTSTSSLWDRGFHGDVEVILSVPKGSYASSIMSISRYGEGEGELLLQAGTRVRCVKITESDGHKDSAIRVFLEVIGNTRHP